MRQRQDHTNLEDSHFNIKLRQTLSPIIILVRPQMPENVGMVARAMLNCKLTQLRMVTPRWMEMGERKDHTKALQTSAGAYSIIEKALVFPSLEEALGDIHYSLGTSARQRDMETPIYGPEHAIQLVFSKIMDTLISIVDQTRSMPTQEVDQKLFQKCALVFGPERTGLENEDVALLNGSINIPLNPSFPSLNLAQAVLLVGYEWRKKYLEAEEIFLPAEVGRLDEASQQLSTQAAAMKVARTEKVLETLPIRGTLASHKEIQYFIDRLLHELSIAGFLRHEEKKPIMVQSIKNIFTRIPLTEQEVRTLQGILTSLTQFRN